MADRTFYEIGFEWMRMSPMEQALWGTVAALNMQEADGGVGAADQALTKLRSVTGARSSRPAPEYEAAKANVNVGYEEFAIWYVVECRIRYVGKPRYQDPSSEEISAAYERFCRGRSDFY